jgi:hypothetical protein
VIGEVDRVGGVIFGGVVMGDRGIVNWQFCYLRYLRLVKRKRERVVYGFLCKRIVFELTTVPYCALPTIFKK